MGDSRIKVLDFCRALVSQMTRDSFMYHKLLDDMGCLPSYNQFYSTSIEAMDNETERPTSASIEAVDNENEALASTLKGIGGVHNVNKKNRKKKNQSGEDSSSKSAPEQGFVFVAVQKKNHRGSGE